MREPDLLVTGETIQGNLGDASAVVDSASFLMHQHRLRGQASQLVRKTDGTIEITDGDFTTCEPGSDAWVLRGESVELDQEAGRGIARKVTLRVKDVPVAWIPWMRFPLDARRQSGFLVPGIGRDSESGADIAIPYYFNLAPNLDATYTLRILGKRGIMHEGELRYLTPSTENQVAATYLPDDDIFDNRSVVDLAAPDTFERQDRWLGYLKHRGYYGNWSTRADYAGTSDIDYFDDLDGFTNVESDLDRNLDQSQSPALLREGALTFRKDQWYSSLEARSFQPLSRGQPEQYQVLPRLTVAGRHLLGPVNVSGLMQLTSFDNKDNARVTGERTVLDTSLSLPLRNAWGYATPSVRVYHRQYSLDGVAAGTDESPELTTGSAALDAGLFLERPFNWRNRELTQTLEPRLHYLYVEESSQDNLPLFDSTLVTPSYDTLFRNRRYTGYDRVGDANRFALGLTTRFLDERGVQRFAASAGQLYHLEDRAITTGVSPGSDPTTSRSPLFLSLALSGNRLSGYASYEFEPDSTRSNRSFVSVRYRPGDQTLLNFSYAMTNSLVQRNTLIRDEEETDISLIWPVSEAWQVVARWNYGWDSGQTIESLLGLEYNDCCWRARVLFRRNLDEPRFITLTAPGQQPEQVVERRSENGIYFEFQLKGLGSLGGRLDAMLIDAIPGYTGTGH